MALTPKLELRQAQQLVLTPQLQQAIKLLQLNNMELAEYVSMEAERNPLLEVGEDESGADTEGGEAAEPEQPDWEEDGIPAADQPLNGATSDLSATDSALDNDYSENVFNNDSVADSAGGSSQLGLSGAGSISTAGGSYENEGDFQPRLSETKSLQEHVREQISMTIADQADRLVASYLVDLLDDTGYLADDLSDVPDRLGCTPEDLERIIGQLQTMEPAGIFARDLTECLALQLKDRNRLDPAMEKLLANLDLVGKQNWAALKQACRATDEDLAGMLDDLRACHPKPGHLFGVEDVQVVVPDIFVRRASGGGWAIELNSETLPKVLVNHHYYAELSKQTGSKADRTYLNECLSGANWLVKALDQRARTILKVSRELVRRQDEFFEKGIRHLKPLTLRDIAEAIDMHESTVSRVTSNKYMATNRGVFELKYFFSTAIASATGGDSHSSESIRHRIKELIDGESPDAILSDDKLVEILRAEGVDIARRTVAKYREALRIPSSVQRRREKRMAG